MVLGGQAGPVTRRDQALAALVALIWGVNFVVIDVGMGDVPPLLFLAARFTAVVLPAVFLVPRPTVGWRVVVGVGLTMSLGQFGFLYLSLDAGMPPGLAGLVLQAQVVLTVVLAAAVLRERPTAGQRAGVVLGVAGLAVVALGRGGHVPLGALALCLAGAAMWAVGNVIARASGSRAQSSGPARAASGLSLTVWSALVVPVPLVLLSLVVDGPSGLGDAARAFGPAAALSTLYTAGLASLVGYGIFNGLLARNASAAVVPWILLVPPVAITSAWLLLGERPSLGELVGGAVLVTGVLVASRPPRGTVRPGGRAQRPDSVYAGPRPSRLASAARTRRAVKSAARSSTSSSVRNAAERISRA